MTSSDVFASIRDLIVHLHRGNAERAELIVNEVAGCLTEVLRAGPDPDSVDMQRAQQTMFAIDEVRMLLGQGDLEGAADAARDAAKEWRQPSSRAT